MKETRQEMTKVLGRTLRAWWRSDPDALTFPLSAVALFLGVLNVTVTNAFSHEQSLLYGILPESRNKQN